EVDALDGPGPLGAQAADPVVPVDGVVTDGRGDLGTVLPEGARRLEPHLRQHRRHRAVRAGEVTGRAAVSVEGARLRLQLDAELDAVAQLQARRQFDSRLGR